jgi:serine/threonine protein kinase
VIPPGRLGSGNFGTVLAVKETRTGALGVLKLFRKSTQDVFLLVREKNFLLQAARSNCRYLIRYVDDCSVGDGSGGQLLYLVLSPLCRETMEQRLTRAQNRRGEGAEGDYSYAVAVKYLMQAALAVRALHRRRIIHCDLALRNILLTYGDNIRLCDFGVAEDERKGAVSTRKRPWKNMSVSLAPEMSVDHPDSLRKKGDKKRGPRFDTRADCWSFGVLVYALLIKSAALAGERHLFPEARKVQGKTEKAHANLDTAFHVE